MKDKSGILLYLHCRDCLDQLEPPDVEIGVTQEGDLVIWCARHEKLVMRVNNSEASETLLELLGGGCDDRAHHEEPAN